MKKLLFVLVCAASLGFWMSCSNETQELDVTLHSGVDTKEYSNAGTVAAKKMTMVTHKGAKVEYKDGKVANKPTDRDDYYISVVEELSADKKSVKYNEYWFYNDWDSGTDIAADKAYVSWESNVSYNNDGASSGKENVSNSKTYNFSFGTHNDDVDFWIELPIQKNGSVYQYTGSYTSRQPDEYGSYREVKIYYDNVYGTAALEVSGNLEGDFTIGTFVKKLDSKYGEKEEGEDYGNGDKYQRLDERTVYEPIKEDVYDDDGYPVYDEYGRPATVVTGYRAKKISANTSVYYLKDVKFTKN